ncbi:hypothetical protein [Rhodovulum viride]|uniref:hypothetical protein n=1 Tax=Rhodovulum viride TaxID=1231134 RepID=UPI0015EB792A|nr:hypothetical protein [Rhodovulum viride]
MAGDKLAIGFMPTGRGAMADLLADLKGPEGNERDLEAFSMAIARSRKASGPACKSCHDRFGTVPVRGNVHRLRPASRKCHPQKTSQGTGALVFSRGAVIPTRVSS